MIPARSLTIMAAAWFAACSLQFAPAPARSEAGVSVDAAPNGESPTTLAPVTPGGVTEYVEVPDTPATPSVRRVGRVTDGPVAPDTPRAGDCGAWADVFRHYGATEREVAWFVPVIRRETTCGTDFINEATSDRYVCQINGVHSQPGYAYGTYYGDGGWMLELFGLSGGRAVTTQAEASTVLAVPACLWLLRGGTTPDTFRGAYHWRPR